MKNSFEVLCSIWMTQHVLLLWREESRNCLDQGRRPRLASRVSSYTFSGALNRRPLCTSRGSKPTMSEFSSCSSSSFCRLRATSSRRWKRRSLALWHLSQGPGHFPVIKGINQKSTSGKNHAPVCQDRPNCSMLLASSRGRRRIRSSLGLPL